MNANLSPNERLHAAIASAPLKQMDATLLAAALRPAAVTEDEVAALDFAINLASWGHRAQTRRNRGPMKTTHYIEHPLRNAVRILRWGVADLDIIIAAVLHDTVEDCAEILMAEVFGMTGLGEIEARQQLLAEYGARFGARVAELVNAVTNPLPAPDSTRAQRVVAYHDHVIAEIADAGVFMVKVSDLLDNAGALHHLLAQPGNEKMVNSNAAKYGPVMGAIVARAVQPDLLSLMSAEGSEQLRSSIAAMRLRLAELSDTPRPIVAA